MKKGTISLQYILVFLRRLNLEPKSHIQAVQIFEALACRPEGLRAYPRFLTKSRHIDVRLPTRNMIVKEVEIL